MTVNRYQNGSFGEVVDVAVSEGAGYGGTATVLVKRPDGSWKQIYPSESFPSSVVSRWEATAGSGTTLTDTVGSDDLTIDGATWVSDAKYEGGAALDYDGTDDNSNGSFSYKAGPSKATTYSIWVDDYTNVDDAFLDAFLTFTSPNEGAGVGITNDSDGTVFIFTSGDNTQDSQSIQIDDGNIHHVVVVYDQANDSVTQYVDNTLDYSITYTDTADQTGSDVTVGIGFDPDNGNQADATIDDVAVFDEALSAEQVDEIYNAHPST